MPREMQIYRRAGKPVLDVCLGGILFLLAVPLMGVIAGMILMKLGSPVLFKQRRPGKDNLPFVLYKFRTMSEEYDSSGRRLPDSHRISKSGRFLRSLSLDEFPELFNVLKGDMSLVGPRPLLMKYLNRYTLEQVRRHEVKPGITGWAQVNGRNAITWEDKFKYDVWYADHLSFWMDMKILIMTVLKVIKRESINQTGRVTMEEFTGSHG
jgi:sugar transferase EpsL